MNNLQFKFIVFAAAFASLVFGSAGGAVTTFLLMNNSSEVTDSDSESVTLNMSEPSFSYAWEKASPAVVSIVELKDLSEYYNNFFFSPFGTNSAPDDSEDSGELQPVGAGTAFIISEDGLAVTNKHVVNDESGQFVAILSDGTQVDVEVLAKDTLNDIALLQLSSEDLDSYPTVELADSDSLSVGDHVLAIGNAAGEYANTSTAGIISATGRQIVAGGYGERSKSLVGLLQTDAAINPGNSGGPLVNLAGEVIGMNTAIDSSSQGIGFAIPSNDIEVVVKSYEENGKIVRPFLGVRYMLITPAISKKNNLSVDHGAYVVADIQQGLIAVLQDSPADKAGVKEGDIILSIEGKEISQDYDLSSAISRYMVGDTVSLEILRDGKTINVDLKLEERQEEKVEK